MLVPRLKTVELLVIHTTICNTLFIDYIECVGIQASKFVKKLQWLKQLDRYVAQPKSEDICVTQNDCTDLHFHTLTPPMKNLLKPALCFNRCYCKAFIVVQTNACCFKYSFILTIIIKCRIS